MQIQIHSADDEAGDPVINHAYREVDDALAVFGEQVTRVEVHLHDEDGTAKSGLGKRCVIEVRLAGHAPLGVDHTTHDMYEAIKIAAGKAERRRNRLGRRRERKQKHDK